MSIRAAAGATSVGLALVLAFAGAAQVSGGDVSQDRAGGGAPVYAIEATEGGPAQDCAIKGNIARSDDRIYHVPGGAFYERTKISESAGERWFCSEGEAVAAGWRRSLR
jgi:hypothetical protein